MSDLISRKALCDFCMNTKDRTVDANDIMRFPSAESGERVVKLRARGTAVWATCDCGQGVHMGWNYCPFCGARLERK